MRPLFTWTTVLRSLDPGRVESLSGSSDERSEEDLSCESGITFRRVAVTDRNVLGKTVDELNLDDRSA